MAVRQLRFNNDEALRKKSREVKEVNEKIRILLDDMMDSLHASKNGAALAANQVGILRRLVVIDYEGYYLNLVNPVIIESDGEQECIEGCLSFPGIFGKTKRPMRVKVEALNENGDKIVLDCSGEMAKCLCHEIDHLDGIVFTDKVTEFLDVE